MRRRLVVSVVVGLVAAAGAAATSACSDRRGGSSVQGASDVARRTASGLADTFYTFLKPASSNAQGEGRMWAWLTSTPGATKGGDYLVAPLGHSADADSARISLAIYGMGEGPQGGDPWHRATVLLCVELSGQHGPQPHVGVSDINCPDTPPPGAPLAVEATITMQSSG